MSLQRKVLTFMATMIALMVALNYHVLNRIVLPSFHGLEREEAIRNDARGQRAIDAALDAVSRAALDYALWTETYAFAGGERPQYPDTFTEDWFPNTGLKLMAVYDTAGNVLWRHLGEVVPDRRLGFDPLDTERSPALRALLAAVTPDRPLAGVVMTDDGPMLIAGHAIRDPDGRLPSRGVMLLGRLEDGAAIAELGEQVENSSIALVPAGSDLPAGAAGGEGVVIVEGEDALVSRSLRRDIYGQPAFFLRMEHPRTIAALGARTVDFALISLLLIGVSDILLIGLMLRLLVLRPVAELTGRVVEAAKTGAGGTLPASRRDELGTLAREYNVMLERLAFLRREVQEQSFHAGRADVAAGTLHNVRNALTPLVGRLDHSISLLQEAAPPHLDRALAELADPATPAERRTRIAEFLAVSAKALQEQVHAVIAELEAGRGNTVAISQILDDQQAAAGRPPDIEPVDLAALVGEAAAMVRRQFGPAVTVEIDAQLSEMPSVRAHRIGLFQVVHNLLINAAEAIQRSGRPAGHVRITASPRLEDGRAALCVEIADDGEGIAPERLNAIFERGVTSKPRGRGGLGLHWCANTIGAMHGRLLASSPGPGRGATFQLIMPTATAT